MSPHGQLTRLRVEKAGLRTRIALRRMECAEAAAVVVRPLAWIDRAWTLWARAGPVLKEVAAAWAHDSNPAGSRAGAVWRWIPTAAALWRACRPRRDIVEAPP